MQEGRQMGVPVADARLVDLILYLAELKRRNVKLDVRRLKESLGDRFSPGQIEDAVAFLDLHPGDDRPARIFADYELSRFSEEAAQLLLKLYALGVIADYQLEAIVMQADYEDEVLSVDDVKSFVAIVLSNPDEFESGSFPVFPEEEIEN